MLAATAVYCTVLCCSILYYIVMYPLETDVTRGLRYYTVLYCTFKVLTVVVVSIEGLDVKKKIPSLS